MSDFDIHDHSMVSSFYDGRSIFVTGGTGFMGKVLLEKLLRSCPGIEKIYILIRHKKGVASQDRLDNLVKDPFFQRAITDKSVFKKLVAIEGDITKPELGITPSDMALIREKVTVIFHSAATVRFDEDLAEAIKINVLAPLAIIALARSIGPDRFAALIQVSTAYSHSYLPSNSLIEEKFIPMPPTMWTKMSPMEIITYYNTAKLNGKNVTPDIIGNYPNTYTFTKSMAEKIAQENGSDLPMAIIRPSIVVAAYKEPIPGWVDNLNGPTGILVGAGKGVLHTIHAVGDKKMDLIPVDTAINLMCALPWKVANDFSSQQPCGRDIPIYNCTSGSRIPITCDQAKEAILQNTLKHPMDGMVWYPYMVFTNSKSSWLARQRATRFIVHWIPAYFADALTWVCGKKSYNFQNIIKKAERASNVLKPFTSAEWNWDCKNVMSLHEELSETDKVRFDFSLKDFMDWNTFFEQYQLGVREFVCKSDPKTLDASRKALKSFHLAHRMVRFLPLVFLMIMIYYLWMSFFSFTADELKAL